MPYVNQVAVNGATIIDLTADTVTPSALAQGYTAHDATGAPITGTATGGSMVIRDEADSHGGTIRHITAGSVVQGTLEVTENGTYDVAAYADVDVDVASQAPSLQSKTATPTTSQQIITADSGYDGLSQVTVSAMPSGSASTPATSITANPSISVDSSTGLITASVSGSKSVTPSVSAGYVSSGTAGTISVSGSNTSQLTTQAAKTITPSTSSQTAVAAGRYTTGAVTVDAMPSGTEGTPKATKGSVSNHAVSVTPSVTNTAGYINGGTKTGTAVSVSASELVSGTKSITANGTGIDVTEYAAVDVAVPSVSPTLITKSITENGTYNASSDNADGYSSVTVNVSGGGGGGGGDMSDPIRFFDYDGTLVASYSAVPESLPSVPTHSKLTNGTWNYTLAQVATQFNAMGTCDVGANYDTVSGATEIDIELQEGRLHPYLSLAINGTVTIDWGDNSTDTATATSLTIRQSIDHEYAAAGSYTIKIAKTSGTGYSLYCTSSYTLLNNNRTSVAANRVYSNCVQAVRVGEDCAIGSYAFYYCAALKSVSFHSGVTSIGTYAFNQCEALTSVSIPSGITSISNNVFSNCTALTSVSIPSGVTSIVNYMFNQCTVLESVSIPSGVTSIGTYAFSYCNALASVSIPSGVTSIGTYAFSYCHALKSVSIPSGVTSIDGSAFTGCVLLTSVSIPSGVTSFGNSAFNNCYSLTSISIPSGVTSIGSSAFSYCYGMTEYHFEPTTPPTLANTNAFTGIPSDCVIYVPQGCLEAYQTATNWSNYASYMQEEVA